MIPAFDAWLDVIECQLVVWKRLIAIHTTERIPLEYSLSAREIGFYHRLAVSSRNCVRMRCVSPQMTYSPN